MLHFGDPSKPYQLKNFTGPNAYHNWASENQDICTQTLLQGRVKNGFFVEAGGYDGENLSNTLYLERYHNWTGLLIEPNPLLFSRILPLNRRCAVVNSGISTVPDRAINISFKLAGPLGGIVDHLTPKHQLRITNELLSKDHTSWAHTTEGSGEVVTVSCHPLDHLLYLAGNTRLVVDYLSLDTEGSELAILRAINFTQITFGVVGIEHNNRDGWKAAIARILTAAGFVHFKQVNWHLGHADVVYYNPVYFGERGIPLPTETMKCP